MNGTLQKLLLSMLLCGFAVAVGAASAVAQPAGGRQLVDSVEEYQKKLQTLISERLNAVVPSQNFHLRIFVLGKNIEVPLPAGKRDAFALPGFRRQGDAQLNRTETKFLVEKITVSVVVNEALAQQESEYIKTIVPLLAEFREDRGDELNLRVVAPAEKPKKPKGAAFGEEPPLVNFDLAPKDWILLVGLGLILLLLLVVLLRVLKAPKPAPMPQQMPPMPYQALQPSQANGRAQKEQEDLLKEQELENQLAAVRQSAIKGMFARPDLGRQLVQAWQSQPKKLSGLIHALGPTIARQLMLPNFSREQYQPLEEAALTDLKPPTTGNKIELLRETNLFFLAQDLANPEEIRPDPFSFLRNLSWGQIGHLVKNEPLNVKAIVLGRIDPADAAKILGTLPQEAQLETAVHVGNLKSMPLDMAEGVARDLAVKARSLPDAKTVDIIGAKALVDMMGEAPVATSRYLLNAMKAKDSELSQAVESRFFMFDAIPLVPPELLPQVVRSMPSETVVQALQGASQDIQRTVIMAFPEQARTGLVTTLRAAQFDEETILEARRKLVGGFQALAEKGKIDLKQISDAWQAKAS